MSETKRFLIHQSRYFLVQGILTLLFTANGNHINQVSLFWNGIVYFKLFNRFLILHSSRRQTLVLSHHQTGQSTTHSRRASTRAFLKPFFFVACILRNFMNTAHYSDINREARGPKTKLIKKSFCLDFYRIHNGNWSIRCHTSA